MSTTTKTFADELVAALAAVGLNAEITTTGGGCMAVEVLLSKDATSVKGYSDILITDGDAGLPDGQGAYVGRYNGDDDPIEFLSTEDEVSIADFVSAALVAAGRIDEHIDIAIARGKREILDDLAEWGVNDDDFDRSTIKTFGDLHDYCDANQYGGLCDDDSPIAWSSQHMTDYANRVQSALNAWIVEGGHLKPFYEINEVAVAEGALRDGEHVKLTGLMVRDGVVARTTSSGIFEGVKVDEGEPYAMFRDGEINGVPQAHWGFPTKHLVHTHTVIADEPDEEPAERPTTWAEVGHKKALTDLFSNDNEWEADFECYVYAWEAEGFDEPCSFGVSPVVNRRVMEALVARQAQYVIDYGADSASTMTWVGDTVVDQRESEDEDMTVRLSPDVDGLYHLSALGYCWSRLDTEDRVLRPQRSV